MAYEAELWPRWVPLCSSADLLQTLGPMERLTYMQFELPMLGALRRGSVVHWSLADSFAEHRCLLLLGGSVSPESVPPPPAAGGIQQMDFRAIKVRS